MVALDENVKKLIKERFSLGDKGFNDFNELIEKNAKNPPQEFDFIYESDEKRNILKIPADLKPYIDDGYPIIKTLKRFCDNYNIGYDEYNSGRVFVSGNERKLFKLLTEHYIENIKERFRNNGCNPDHSVSYGLFRDVCGGSTFWEVMMCFEKYYKPSERKLFEERLRGRDIDDVCGIVNEIITKIFEKIGAFKIKTDKDLYLVISKNLNDFFLCSHEKGWTSCLNPESTSGLWSALPFLMTDIGRCCIYISDLEEKEYLGIKSYRMFKRGWGIVGTNGIDERIYTGMYYPSKTRMDNTFYEKMGLLNVLKDMEHPFMSKYPIELFYNTYNVFDYIYQDDTRFVHGYDGKLRLKDGERNHSIVVNHPLEGIMFYDYRMAGEGHTLTNLIQNDEHIGMYPSDHFCKECKRISNDKKKISYKIDGITHETCQRCFNEAIKTKEMQCTFCGGKIDFRTDFSLIDKNLVCGQCYRRSIMKRNGNPYNSLFSSGSPFDYNTPVFERDEAVPDNEVEVTAYRNNSNGGNPLKVGTIKYQMPITAERIETSHYERAIRELGQVLGEGSVGIPYSGGLFRVENSPSQYRRYEAVEDHDDDEEEYDEDRYDDEEYNEDEDNNF